jgi:hypothetical protein
MVRQAYLNLDAIMSPSLKRRPDHDPGDGLVHSDRTANERMGSLALSSRDLRAYDPILPAFFCFLITRLPIKQRAMTGIFPRHLKKSGSLPTKLSGNQQ